MAMGWLRLLLKDTAFRHTQRGWMHIEVATPHQKISSAARAFDVQSVVLWMICCLHLLCTLSVLSYILGCNRTIYMETQFEQNH